MRFTIGMACYQDFSGAYFTAQSLRLHHADDLHDSEVLIVDNAPSSRDGQLLRELVTSWNHSSHPVTWRYVAAPEVVGTSAPRNRIFAEARGEYVVCLDAHVLLAPGAIKSLQTHWERYPDQRDLLHGPLLYDDLVRFATHFDDEWREEMWGVWNTDPRGSGSEPFEIPAMGLGAFACRRDAWLGFNPKFRGFGGEEWYIHEKFRKHGRRVWCIPGFRWLHRFGRPQGVPYPLNRNDRIRNYILGLTELGLPLDRCRDHFRSRGLTDAEWESLMKEAFQNSLPDTPARSGCGCNKASSPGAPVPTTRSYEELLQEARSSNPVFSRLEPWITSSSRVVEFQRYRDSFSFLLMSRQPAQIFSHASNTPALAEGHTRQQGPTTIYISHKSSLEASARDCDLLYLNEGLVGDDLWNSLHRHAALCTGRIVIVSVSPDRLETSQSGPGVMPAVRKFLRENPEWTLLARWEEPPGFIVLTRLPSDKTPLPPLWKQSWNFIRSAWRSGANVAELGPLAGTEAQEKRLELCTVCEFRNEERCGYCGCNLQLKTSWPRESCPKGRWHALESSTDRS